MERNRRRQLFLLLVALVLPSLAIAGLLRMTTVRPVICCGIVNRGIALYNGMIIAPSIDGRLFALNATTGKPVRAAR